VVHIANADRSDTVQIRYRFFDQEIGLIMRKNADWQKPEHSQNHDFDSKNSAKVQKWFRKRPDDFEWSIISIFSEAVPKSREF